MLKLPWKHIYFSGCGGVGMAALAQIVLDCQVKVSGSDLQDSELLQVLRERSCNIRLYQDSYLPDDIDLFVYSSAVPSDNPERLSAEQRNVPSLNRGAFLAELASFFPTVIAIAGSHGKTTTSAMLTHIAEKANLQPGFLIGGKVEGRKRSGSAGAGKIFITEVDESDGTQALISANLALILNIDDDHCWSLGGTENLEKCFSDFAQKAEKVFAWKDPETERVLANLLNCQFFEFSEDAALTNSLLLPGLHNRYNAAMAIKAASFLGINEKQAIKALEDFKGVDRRFTIHWQNPNENKILLEDYAHHPTELQAVIEAIKEKWTKQKIYLVFQPHRYERIKRYSKKFAEILSKVDKVWIAAPFAAWKKDQEIADPQTIVDLINQKNAAKAEKVSSDPQDICRVLQEGLANQDNITLALIGAGDIGNAVKPIKEMWQKM